VTILIPISTSHAKLAGAEAGVIPRRRSNTGAGFFDRPAMPAAPFPGAAPIALGAVIGIVLKTRSGQLFPLLDAAEIGRIGRLGQRRT